MKIKQLFVGAAMVGLLGMVPSLARAEVSSAVIGMQEIEITSTWTLLGVSFFDMTDADAKTISIHDFLSGDFVAGDQIQVPNDAGAYKIAEWNETVGAWCARARGGVTDTLSTATLKSGDGIWLKKVDASTASPKTITTFGRVILSPEVTVEFPNQYKLVSLPIFEEVEINSDKFTWSGLAHGDMVQVPNDAGAYTIAAWNETVGAWCVQTRRGITDTLSTLTVKPFVGAWLVSTSASATCTYKASK